MKYQSALSLKKKIVGQKNVSAVAFATAASPQVQRSAPKIKAVPPVAIGLTGSKNKFKIAIRIQEHSNLLSSFIHDIRKQAKGEIDVRIIGNVHKQPWHQNRNRPLRIGGSIGHPDITAGTLGCFVTKDGSEDFILSNNHVLANENNAKKGDNIIQPGDADGGSEPNDVVGTLDKFVRLSKTKVNLVDCAIASIKEDMEYFFDHLETLGPIKGIRTTPLDEGEVVFKVGRTTGVTEGLVAAIEVDQVRVGFDMGVLEFNNQIEIEPVGNEPFSLGGDSGSLIVDSDLNAVGLLFAGNDVDATFANPIQTVLDKLGVSLVF